MSKPKYEIYIPKSKDDPERAITPVLMYATKSNEYIKVSILTLGWWKWGIAIKRVVEL